MFWGLNTNYAEGCFYIKLQFLVFTDKRVITVRLNWLRSLTHGNI